MVRAIHTNDTDSSARPARTTRVVPTRWTTRGASTEASAIEIATGRVRTQASSGP